MLSNSLLFTKNVRYKKKFDVHVNVLIFSLVSFMYVKQFIKTIKICSVFDPEYDRYEHVSFKISKNEYS